MMRKNHVGITLDVLLSLPPVPPSVTAGELAMDLYPEIPMTAARLRLNMALHSLRKHGWQIEQSPEGYLLLQRDQYSLLGHWSRRRSHLRRLPRPFTPEAMRKEIQI